MEKPKVVVFVLDDDQDTLDLIKEDFEEAGIKDYELFTSEREFLAKFNENVHVAVLDHYLQGSAEIGYDIMQTIFEMNRKHNSPIQCKVIIISGQKNQQVTKWYLNNGAFKYLDKGEDGFNSNLISYVKQAVADAEVALTAYNALVEMKNTMK